MGDEAVEPGELVVEFRTGLRVAVWRIERGDDYAVHCRLDVAALRVVRVAGQDVAGDDRGRIAGEDGNAVPGLLAAPNRLVAGALDRGGGEFAIGRLQLLQADDIGRGLAEPRQKIGQPPPDVVDVEAGDFHQGFLTETACATSRTETSRMSPEEGEATLGR